MATAIEYGLIAALIGVSVIASIGPLGKALDETFNGAAENVEEAPASNHPSSSELTVDGKAVTRIDAASCGSALSYEQLPSGDLDVWCADQHAAPLSQSP